MNCNSRLDAEQIHGRKFFLPRKKFKKLGENEYYLVDLVGSKVFNENKKLLGVVIDILAMPSQHLIVVKRENDEILMINYEINYDIDLIKHIFYTI